MNGMEVFPTEVMSVELNKTAAMDVSHEVEILLQMQVKEPYSMRWIELMADYKGLTVEMWYKVSVQIGR